MAIPDPRMNDMFKFLNKIADLQKENASLKDRISHLDRQLTEAKTRNILAFSIEGVKEQVAAMEEIRRQQYRDLMKDKHVDMSRNTRIDNR